MPSRDPSKEPFLHIFALDAIKDGGVEDIEITATPEDLKAIAKRLEILELKGLTVEGKLQRVKGENRLDFTGRLLADVVQACVVSLAPVEEGINEPLELSFMEGVDPPVEAAADIELVFEQNAIDEPMRDGKANLGEVVIQQLSLALNPYPRAKGAAFDEKKWGGTANDNPFAKLKDLQTKKDE